MAPIYDTDVAKERWQKDEWRNYELWEKLELQAKKRKQLWILGAVILFLMLSGVPAIMDRLPKWRTLKIANEVAARINEVKTQAVFTHHTHRVRFGTPSGLDFLVEEVASCRPDAKVIKTVATGTLASSGSPEDYTVLSNAQAQELNIPGVIGEFCYDPVLGYSGLGPSGVGAQSVIALAYVNDLTEPVRMNRMTLLTLEGESAEVAFY